MRRRAWAIVRDTVSGFIDDEAMTRGAAIACYTMFSIAPPLVVCTWSTPWRPLALEATSDT